jgi:hypothetical protein
MRFIARNTFSARCPGSPANPRGVALGPQPAVERKTLLFLKKKRQKTFASCAGAASRARMPTQVKLQGSKSLSAAFSPEKADSVF